ALGRPLGGNPMHDVELICGARRLFVARALNVPLLTELRNLSDREACIALEIENRQRQDISPYERGLSYDRWLKRNHFQSQEELANSLGVSASQVSRLLTLARLPAIVVGAFASSADIREAWGLELFEAWRDPQRRPTLARRARSLAKRATTLEASAVYEAMLGGAGSRRSAQTHHRDEAVTGRNGAVLFRVSYRRDTVALVLPARSLSTPTLRQLKSILADFLQVGTRQPLHLQEEIKPVSAIQEMRP